LLDSSGGEADNPSKYNKYNGPFVHMFKK